MSAGGLVTLPTFKVPRNLKFDEKPNEKMAEHITNEKGIECKEVNFVTTTTDPFRYHSETHPKLKALLLDVKDGMILVTPPGQHTQEISPKDFLADKKENFIGLRIEPGWEFWCLKWQYIGEVS